MWLSARSLVLSFFIQQQPIRRMISMPSHFLSQWKHHCLRYCPLFLASSLGSKLLCGSCLSLCCPDCSQPVASLSMCFCPSLLLCNCNNNSGTIRWNQGAYDWDPLKFQKNTNFQVPKIPVDPGKFSIWKITENLIRALTAQENCPGAFKYTPRAFTWHNINVLMIWIRKQIRRTVPLNVTKWPVFLTLILHRPQ